MLIFQLKKKKQLLFLHNGWVNKIGSHDNSCIATVVTVSDKCRGVRNPFARTFVYSRLWQVTNQMQDKIDDRLNWLSNHLGGTGDKLAFLSVCLLHVGYFLVATLCILFLNAPLFTRLFLLILVPVNAWCEIKFRSSLTYGTLSLFLVLALLGWYI